MSLSVCMIVRDEAPRIAAALASVQACADEIVVVDTGSTDGTPEIVRELAAALPVTLLSAEWQDNFSQARNLSIEAATKEWIFWLDGDDVLMSGEADKINKLKKAPTDRAFAFRVINAEDGLALGSSFLQLRMVPRRPDVRFEGSIHEQLSPSCLRAGLRRIPVDVRIQHTGYDDQETKKKKAARNLELLLKDPLDTPAYKKHISDAFFILGETEAAIEWQIKLYTEETKSIHFDLWRQAPLQAAIGFFLLGDDEKAKEWVLKADPAMCDVLYYRGLICEKRHEYEESLESYLTCIDAPDEICTVARDLDFCRVHACHRALRILAAFKKLDQATHLLEVMYRKYPKKRLDYEV